jgi:hypothetical protein
MRTIPKLTARTIARIQSPNETWLIMSTVRGCQVNTQKEQV